MPWTCHSPDSNSLACVKPMSLCQSIAFGFFSSSHCRILNILTFSIFGIQIRIYIFFNIAEIRRVNKRLNNTYNGKHKSGNKRSNTQVCI